LTNFDTSRVNGGNGGQEHTSSFVNRREMRVNNNTGSMPAISTGRNYSGAFDFEAMIVSLHELFEHDRQVASQPDAVRCGICYLYFPVGELRYRDEEGLYVCSNCERQLGKHQLPMLRKQKK
jgi:hypothetical protein